MRYTVVLEQEPDGGYVVSVPALPGCVTQGDTRTEALANIYEAIELYIADCRDAGDPVPTEAGRDSSVFESADNGPLFPNLARGGADLCISCPATGSARGRSSGTVLI